MTSTPGFKDQQLKFDRVKSAYTEKELAVKELLKSRKADRGYKLFLRAFKWEQQLEVWIKPNGTDIYQLLTTYEFCTSSGVLGPKRKEGDLQIPEGIYSINHFNPFSTFHLSLGINYPNASDRILSDKKHPGGAIYIHGSCVSIGCIPITDDKIKELYVLTVEARNEGQENIPVHIFPAKLDKGRIEQISDVTTVTEETVLFWKNLEPVYADFESTKKIRGVKVEKDGRYLLK
jgi:murein L,D-transpeptidase YafK